MAGSGSQSARHDQVSSRFGYSVTLPVGTDVSVRDRILVNTHTLEVVGTSGARTEACGLRLDCVEVDAP
jgi:hypothetical protein